jgi:dTDP-4-amino-4,6-dideoxygalactose transaminase
MHVPFLDLKAQYQTIKPEIKQAVDEVLESQHFILGPKVEELEEKIAEYSGTDYAVGVSSGSDALLISLMALDVKPGDEIITTPFTFFATAGVIARLQAKPVFVDIDPATYNIAPDLIENAITSRTVGIIPVHLFGQCADMDLILNIAKRHNLFVLEDAAQSIGAEYHSKRAGTMGDCGIYSFFPSKNLGGLGDGGMVVTSNKTLYDKLKVLRVHGSKPKYFHKIVGGNFRLDAIQAAPLTVKLQYLDNWSEKRRENAAVYDEAFNQSDIVQKGFLQTPEPIYADTRDLNYHIYNQYTIRAADRDKLKAQLSEKGIGTCIYYPCCLHLQDCFSELNYNEADLPHAEIAAQDVLSLPIYPELTEEQQHYVIDNVVSFYDQ